MPVLKLLPRTLATKCNYGKYITKFFAHTGLGDHDMLKIIQLMLVYI